MLVYDEYTQQYKSKKREPRWEAYLEKQMNENGVVAYKGEFYFMCFRFSIIGVWDAVQGMEKKRINFFVERMPMNEQNIINGLNKRNTKNNG